MSPAGTAELSPGRSPGLACTVDKPRRATEKLFEMKWLSVVPTDSNLYREKPQRATVPQQAAPLC
jgi:hypothetical protein